MLLAIQPCASPAVLSAGPGSSNRPEYAEESMHYTNPDDCGYVREPIFGQDDFIARELDLGDEGGQKRGGPGFHRFLSMQEGGMPEEVIMDMVTSFC